MKRAVLVKVMLALLICASAALSQGGPPPPGGPGGPGGRGGGAGMCSVMSAVMPPKADMIDAITTQLSLTTDQATALGAILAAADEKIPTLVKTAGEKCKAVRAALATGTNLETLVKAAVDAEDAVSTACLATWTKIRTDSGLTADQLAKLATSSCGPPPGGPPGDGSASASSMRRR